MKALLVVFLSFFTMLVYGQYTMEEKTAYDTIFYDKYDKLLCENAFKDGRKHGLWIEYFDKSKEPQSTSKRHRYFRLIQYNKGEVVGLIYDFYANKRLERVGSSTKGNPHVMEGYFEWYYENGKLMLSSHFENDKAHGEEREYYESGKLYRVSHFKNGLEEGREVFYYENGKKKFEIDYRFGQWHGTYKAYYENGEPKYERSYQSGLFCGNMKEWSDEGFLEVSVECEACRDKCVMRKYNEQGQVEEIYEAVVPE